MTDPAIICTTSTPRWLDGGAALRGPVLFGLLVATLFFGAGAGWAALAPLATGVNAPATIVVESKTKPVQHPSGGIVERIHVGEGDRIAAGARLVTLKTAGIERQRTALIAQLGAAKRQLGLLGEEVAIHQGLLDKGLARKSLLLRLRRQYADIEKEIERTNARIAALDEEIARAEIRAPVAGRLLSLAVHARGAVIGPGSVIAVIVPESDPLVIEGRLSPRDIDAVHPGMPAKVWLTALNMRESHPLAASLVWISPDRVDDPRRGSFYRVRVELTRLGELALGKVGLYPGMPAEILIQSGERTLLDQILDPLARNIRRAFR